MSKKILLLPGDGIGPEVMAEARRILEWVRDERKLPLEFSEELIGGASIDRHGTPLAPSALRAALEADAVLFGAVGGPKWEGMDYNRRPEAGLLELRKKMEVFANLRPAIVFDALVDASPLKPEIVRGLDIIIVRELTGGVYFGEPRGIVDIGKGERKGFNTQVYTTSEIRRVARVAFETARKRRGKVCSCEKHNVMESGLLWKQEVTRLHDAEYRDIELSHMLADSCCMQLLRFPKQFDVILTDNLFGDILSDEAAMLTGSIGMLPSASLGAPDTDGHRKALYEPVHGSAPDIAGRNAANPLAMILSAAMMLRISFGFEDEAALIEDAIHHVLDSGLRTADIALPHEKPVGTREMGEAVVMQLQRMT